ncbi:MAG: hypothetical protein Q9169_005425 [Polycauliona sp. 2 TL-2023]
MLGIETRLISHPDRALTHTMFTNIVQKIFYILQWDNPLKVHDPRTFWTFVIDAIFALGSLNTTPSTVDDRMFHLLSMTFDITAMHTADQDFQYLWEHCLGARWKIYAIWTTALQASAGNEEQSAERARKALQEILPSTLSPGHGVDMTEINAALDAETCKMPGNPCWIARLTKNELKTLEFPFDAARSPE